MSSIGKWFKWSNLDCFPNASLIGHPLPLIGRVSATDWSSVSLWLAESDRLMTMMVTIHYPLSTRVTPSKDGAHRSQCSWHQTRGEYSLEHSPALSYTLLRSPTLSYSFSLLLCYNPHPCYNTFLTPHNASLSYTLLHSATPPMVNGNTFNENILFCSLCWRLGAARRERRGIFMTAKQE